MPKVSDRQNAIETDVLMFAAARAKSKEALMLSHGGPIVTPEDAEFVSMRTGAVGFVAASSVERIPVETAIKSACEAFKSARLPSQ